MVNMRQDNKTRSDNEVIRQKISNRADSCPISTDDPKVWVNDGVITRQLPP
jgi:hypothetical protein